MSFNFGTIGFTIVNFIILMIILRIILFDRVNKVIDDRNEEVASTIKMADSQNEEAKALKLESEKNLEESKLQGKNIVENYKQRAEKVSEDIKKEASNEAGLILDRAKKEIDREKEKAEEELRNKVVDLAVILSTKALEKAINEEEHRRLIEEFIAKVGN
jgi:F-type H+-transporting ATPase subunit b